MLNDIVHYPYHSWSAAKLLHLKEACCYHAITCTCNVEDVIRCGWRMWFLPSGILKSLLCQSFFLITFIYLPWTRVNKNTSTTRLLGRIHMTLTLNTWYVSHADSHVCKVHNFFEYALTRNYLIAAGSLWNVWQSILGMTCWKILCSNITVTPRNRNHVVLVTIFSWCAISIRLWGERSWTYHR